MALSSVHALVSRHLCLLRSIMVYSSYYNRWMVLPEFVKCQNCLRLLSLSRQPAKSYATASKKKKETPSPSKEAGLNMDVCVGANIFKTGEDPPIKDDSEYPEWLWGLLDSDKDCSPDSKQYQRRLNKKKARERNALQSQLR